MPMPFLPCSIHALRLSSQPRKIPRPISSSSTNLCADSAPGAPVEFRGIQIGEVSEVRAQINLKTFTFTVPVKITLDPRRLGVNILEAKAVGSLDVMRRKLIDSLVAHGVRAQLRTGNLLTGALYVAFDFVPRCPARDSGLVTGSAALADYSGTARGNRSER